MNLELFIARRLFGTRKGEHRISKPAVTIAQWGVSVGIIVMIVSMCIVVGFKHEIKEKIIGFGGHIQVRNYEAADFGEKPVTVTPDDIGTLESIPGVQHIQQFIQKPGLISVGDEFEGIILKGIGEGYDTTFIASHIVEGSFPHFNDTAASNKIVLSRLIANKLNIAQGDKINIYFVQNGIKARRMTVEGIYETNLNEMDELLAITDIYTTRRLNGWNSNQSAGLEISVTDYDNVATIRDSMISSIEEIADRHRQGLYVQTVEEMNPRMFAWLEVLDGTVWIILVLVLGIAGFTVISGLLILILEKSNLIGVMKALGAQNASVRKIFLYYAMFIIGRGMLWGNIIGFALCLLQQTTGIVALDPTMYYMDRVPIMFTWWLLPMNIAMFIISVAMLVLPSMLISRIEPTKAIKFE